MKIEPDLRDLHAYGGLVMVGVALGFGVAWWSGVGAVGAALFFLAVRK